MVFLLLEKAFRDKHRHVYILHANRFKSAVQFLLDVLPDRVAGRFDHHTALYAGIVDEFRFLHHIGIPLGEVHIHGCDCFY